MHLSVTFFGAIGCFAFLATVPVANSATVQGAVDAAYDGLSVTHRRRALYLCVTDLVANIALSGI